jgi:hypothetical protein
MPVTFNLDLTAEERGRLAGIIQCDPAQLDNAFASYATAAAREYAEMFLGQHVATRGADILQHRLFLLIRAAFGNQIPDEQRVSNLFQTTSSQSRSLIRAVMSKYQYLLSDARTASLRSAVQSVQLVNGSLLLELKSGSVNIVEALNQLVASINPLLPRIVKRADAVSAYQIQPNAYRELCGQYGLNPVPGTPPP